MNPSSTRLPTPEGPGSVSGAPHLPAGFTDTFTSRYVDTGEVGTDVRAFQVDIPEEELAELRRRIEATRWLSI